MMSSSLETPEAARDNGDLLARLNEIGPAADANLSDFADITDLPSPPSLFVKKMIPAIFSQKGNFFAIPTRGKDGQWKRRPGITYMYDLCVKYNLPRSGK